MNAPRSGCPINLTLEALGDRWSLLVIRDLMFGNRRHFRELLTRSEERIASNILADRLTRPEKAGLVSRRDDPSHKQKVIYSLTEVAPWSVRKTAPAGACTKHRVESKNARQERFFLWRSRLFGDNRRPRGRTRSAASVGLCTPCHMTC
jgi:DNA-binding HxlR family transcriptional regulator